MLRFKATKADYDLIDKIVARAVKDTDLDKDERRSLIMDITATHCSGMPLRLAELLVADDFNFWHDVGGITRHIDRSTGQMTRCFVPRFAAKS